MLNDTHERENCKYIQLYQPPGLLRYLALRSVRFTVHVLTVSDVFCNPMHVRCNVD